MAKGGALDSLPPARNSIEEAQDIVYEAWEDGDAKGVALARKALEVSAAAVLPSMPTSQNSPPPFAPKPSSTNSCT
jgi:hypothetical protein